MRLLTEVGGHSIDSLRENFPIAQDYPTAKVDVRAVVLSADKMLLLVQQSSDGLWSLPGGWAEPGFSPSETVVKECKEKTGLDVIPKQLLAVFDKRKHPHPPQATYVYKIVCYCKAVQAKTTKGFDVLDVAFFPVDALPPLS